MQKVLITLALPIRISISISILTCQYLGIFQPPFVLDRELQPRTAHHVVLVVVEHFNYATLNRSSAQLCTGPIHCLHDGKRSSTKRWSAKLTNTKWKGLSVLAASSSPIVVVLSGSMEPAFQRGDLLFLWGRSPRAEVGEVVVCEFGWLQI